MQVIPMAEVAVVSIWLFDEFLSSLVNKLPPTK